MLGAALLANFESSPRCRAPVLAPAVPTSGDAEHPTTCQIVRRGDSDSDHESGGVTVSRHDMYTPPPPCRSCSNTTIATQLGHEHENAVEYHTCVICFDEHISEHGVHIKMDTNCACTFFLCDNSCFERWRRNGAICVYLGSRIFGGSEKG